jgi:hypothetical protein
MHLPPRLLRSFIFSGGLATTLCFSSSALSAEQVVVQYGIFRRSISVADLATFAETGEVPSELNLYLKASRQNPDDVRRVLREETEVSVVTLDRVLNSAAGDLLLDQVGQVVRTPSNRANRQAIRSALILSASQDSRVSLIEVIQNYPTSNVVVEVGLISQVYSQIDEVLGQIQNF